ncbi:trafficking protein particle complex subunit 12-like [Branchiostoma lanceolatum]|uniref:trafficking protein particle complex subunit 12-like n=1 Tax=Branchiostoma lanceolatum TaxID=7740 RepID=UPI003452311E
MDQDKPSSSLELPASLDPNESIDLGNGSPDADTPVQEETGVLHTPSSEFGTPELDTPSSADGIGQVVKDSLERKSVTSDTDVASTGQMSDIPGNLEEVAIDFDSPPDTEGDGLDELQPSSSVDTFPSPTDVDNRMAPTPEVEIAGDVDLTSSNQLGVSESKSDQFDQVMSSFDQKKADPLGLQQPPFDMGLTVKPTEPALFKSVQSGVDLAKFDIQQALSEEQGGGQEVRGQEEDSTYDGIEIPSKHSHGGKGDGPTPPVTYDNEGFLLQEVGSPQEETQVVIHVFNEQQGDVKKDSAMAPSVSSFFQDTPVAAKDTEGSSFFDSLSTAQSAEKTGQEQTDGSCVSVQTKKEEQASQQALHTTPRQLSHDALLHEIDQELHKEGNAASKPKTPSDNGKDAAVAQVQLTSSTEASQNVSDLQDVKEEVKESNVPDRARAFSVETAQEAFESEGAANQKATVGTTHGLFQSAPQGPFGGSTEGTFPGEEDPFTAVINMSEMDRRHDAWVPSERTRKTLVAIATSPPGTVMLEKDQLTMPGIMVDQSQGDPILDLMKKSLGEQEASKRQSLSVDSVSHNEQGLKHLIVTGNLRAAVDMTGRLLAQCGQGMGMAGQLSRHTPQSLQLWFTRIALLVRLRMFSTAEAELEAFSGLDQPDLYYEFYPDTYKGRRGTMVPFHFRVLHAELPQYLGKPHEALDRLYQLLGTCNQIVTNLEKGVAEDGSMLVLSPENRTASLELWKSREVRVQFSITNCAVVLKDFNLAYETMDTILSQEVGDTPQILSAMGRIKLQLGDVKGAQQCFEKAEPLLEDKADGEAVNTTNKAFLALGQGSFAESGQLFEQVYKLQPDNGVAINNTAVCQLYLGNLKEALKMLESVVQEDPNRFVQEGLLFNLCTMYELESSRALAKKHTMLDLVGKHKGDGFNAQSLKIA